MRRASVRLLDATAFAASSRENPCASLVRAHRSNRSTLGPTTFAIFDAFADEAGRQRHLAGPIAQALMAQAPSLFAAPPAIEPLEVLGAKLPA
jgi:quinol monooxygenase YgiN